MITLRRHFSPILMAFFRAKFRHNTASIFREKHGEMCQARNKMTNGIFIWSENRGLKGIFNIK